MWQYDNPEHFRAEKKQIKIKNDNISLFKYIKFPELHADLFSCHASPLEVYVFVTVANRGEDVMSDEICRRFNGKQQ